MRKIEKYTINEDNLNFVLESTDSTVNDLIEWLKFIKKNYFRFKFPCAENAEYLANYSFYDPSRRGNVTFGPDIHVGSIVKEHKSVFSSWNTIRKNDALFNKFISALEEYRIPKKNLKREMDLFQRWNSIIYRI